MSTNEKEIPPIPEKPVYVREEPEYTGLFGFLATLSSDIGFTYGTAFMIFFPILFLATLFNPYFWKLFKDGKFKFSILKSVALIVFFPLLFTLVVSAISVAIGKVTGIDFDCYDYNNECEENNNKLGNIVSIVALTLMFGIIINMYRLTYKTLKIS